MYAVDSFIVSIFRSYPLDLTHLFHQWCFVKRKKIIKDFCFILIVREEFSLVS